MILSIIIPVFNEEKTISELIRKVKNVDLSELEITKELIVVDDGSTDRTKKVLSGIDGITVYSHKTNLGKGAGIKTGIKKAKGDIIIIQDADLEYNPNEYKKLILPIVKGKTKVVFGSRFLGDLQRRRNINFLKRVHTGQYILGYIGGRFLTLLSNFLYGIRITDEATGYKIFDAKLLKKIKLDCIKFEFCPEITAKIAKKGYKIIEVPISYNPRKYEEGKKINWKDGFHAVWTLIKYRFVD
jgi:glycosyltransferase involved in cell wall biosynthesis